MSSLRRALVASAALLCSCESLFGPFLTDNVRRCAADPSVCSTGQVCDVQRDQCVSAVGDGGANPNPCNGLNICTSGQWCSPQSDRCENFPTLYSISGDGQGIVWAVGEGGLVVVWDNSLTPKFLKSGTTVPLRGVSAIKGMKQAWIVGDQETILLADIMTVAKATINGATAAKSLTGVWARSTQSADTVGLAQTTWRYDAIAGKSWNRVTVNTVSDFFGLGGCEEVPPRPVPSLWALGAGGQLFKWGGVTWNNTAEQTMTQNQLFGVTCFDQNNVWAVGAGQTITHFDGTNWALSSSSGTPLRKLSSVSGSGPLDVWTVGDQNTALTWDDSSKSWFSQPCATCRPSDYQSVWAESMGESVWVAGTNGAVAVWNRQTSAWEDRSLSR